MYLLKMARRMLFETDKRLLFKLAWNMGWKGMLSVQKHKHRVKRGAPLLRPVDVFEVDPQRELVQRQARADAERSGEHLVPRRQRRERELEEAAGHHQADPPHEVVQVQAVLGLDAPRPPREFRAADHPCARADEQERQQERPEHDEARALPRVVEE